MTNDKTRPKSQCRNGMNAPSKYNWSERLLKFARRTVEIVKLLPNTPEGNVFKKQLVASGTSVGANYEEADGAVSKRDFINKMGIARKEAKASEIVSILSAIINKSRSSRS